MGIFVGILGGFAACKSMKSLAPQVGFGSDYGIDSIGFIDFIAMRPTHLDKNAFFAQQICHM